MRQFLIVLAMAVTLFSCGGGGDSAEDGKKVFKYNQTGGLTSLDPAFARNRANIWATSQIYNGLVSLNDNLDPEREIASSYEISEDGKTYTFTLRKGVNFHNNECFEGGRGREITAEDFVYSFKRIIDPKTASTGAWIFNDKVLRDAEGNISDTCFVAVNDSTLNIYLQEPSPIFLQILAMPYAFVVPKEAVEKYGEDFRANPVGTGPFVLKSWDERNRMVLDKNTLYWKKDANGKELPYLDAVVVTFIEDPNTAFLEFSDGDLDFLTGISASSREQILNDDGSLKKEFEGNFQVEKVPYLNTEYIGFLMEGDDPKKNPLLNKKIRQALNYAVNREGLVSFLRNGLGSPGNYGIVPNALPSFDTLKVKGYSFDSKKAQVLLKEGMKEIGIEKLPTLKLYTYSSDREIAEYLQKNWKDIGVDVEIETNLFATHQEMVDNGKVAMFRGSWLGDYPDAENYLRMFYGMKSNFAPTGPNKTHYTNEAYDLLFEEAHDKSDLFERYDYYQRMDSMMMADAPVIVLYYDEVIQLRQNRLYGMKANVMNTLYLETVDIRDPNATAESE